MLNEWAAKNFNILPIYNHIEKIRKCLDDLQQLSPKYQLSLTEGIIRLATEMKEKLLEEEEIDKRLKEIEQRFNLSQYKIGDTIKIRHNRMEPINVKR